jgi:hypothetical protein
VAGGFCVHWKGAVTVALDVEVRERIPEVSFGAGFKLLDDTWLSCGHHYDGGAHNRWTPEPGRYEIRLTLENHLKPGLYRLGLGAHSERYTRTLFELETVAVEILDHTRDGATPYVFQPGIVNAYAAWQPPVRLG